MVESHRLDLRPSPSSLPRSENDTDSPSSSYLSRHHEFLTRPHRASSPTAAPTRGCDALLALRAARSLLEPPRPSLHHYCVTSVLLPTASPLSC